MTFDEYQREANKTASYPEKDALYYCGLGLAGESGEVAEKLKKIIRDSNGVLSAEKKEDIIKEIGDVLWYVSQLSTVLEIPLEDVAQRNLDKLSDRQKRNALLGDGDER